MQLDKEEMMSYEQRAFFEKKESKELNPLNIFFAVLAAILVSWFIRMAYVDWQLRQVAETFNEQIKVMNYQSQQQMRMIQLKNEAMQAQAEEKVRLKAEAAMQQRIAAHQIELDRRAAIENEINTRVKKEQAWTAFYKPTKGCEKDNQNRDAILCGNDYMKAHKRFEESWASSLNQ